MKALHRRNSLSFGNSPKENTTVKLDVDLIMREFLNTHPEVSMALFRDKEQLKQDLKSFLLNKLFPKLFGPDKTGQAIYPDLNPKTEADIATDSTSETSLENGNDLVLQTRLNMTMNFTADYAILPMQALYNCRESVAENMALSMVGDLSNIYLGETSHKW